MITVAEKITNSLVATGWYVGQSIFSASLSSGLASRARSLAAAGSLHAARVGRADDAQLNEQTRSDETLWLNDFCDDKFERQALGAVNSLRRALNESLFLGAQSSELHFARYALGAFYKTHRDRFRNDDARVVSLVFYLNDNWPDDCGGELVIYDDNDNALTRVLPRVGTMVCFLSDRFPHEVLPSTQERFSLTGWLSREQPQLQ